MVGEARSMIGQRRGEGAREGYDRVGEGWVGEGRRVERRGALRGGMRW